jgi:hypothetical protein
MSFSLIKFVTLSTLVVSTIGRAETVYQFGQTVKIPVNSETLFCGEMANNGGDFYSVTSLLWDDYSEVTGGELSAGTWGFKAIHRSDELYKTCDSLVSYLISLADADGLLAARVKVEQKIEGAWVCTVEDPPADYALCEDHGGVMIQDPSLPQLIEYVTIKFPNGLVMGAEGILRNLF